MAFPLAHPAVAPTIPGQRGVTAFATNLELLRHPIQTALWAELRRAGSLYPDASAPS
jgi:D-threo-aldose 1-dehydrogenase